MSTLSKPLLYTPSIDNMTAKEVDAAVSSGSESSLVIDSIQAGTKRNIKAVSISRLLEYINRSSMPSYAHNGDYYVQSNTSNVITLYPAIGSSLTRNMSLGRLVDGDRLRFTAIKENEVNVNAELELSAQNGIRSTDLDPDNDAKKFIIHSYGIGSSNNKFSITKVLNKIKDNYNISLHTGSIKNSGTYINEGIFESPVIPGQLINNLITFNQLDLDSTTSGNYWNGVLEFNVDENILNNSSLLNRSTSVVLTKFKFRIADGNIPKSILVTGYKKSSSVNISEEIWDFDNGFNVELDYELDENSNPTGYMVGELDSNYVAFVNLGPKTNGIAIRVLSAIPNCSSIKTLYGSTTGDFDSSKSCTGYSVSFSDLIISVKRGTQSTLGYGTNKLTVGTGYENILIGMNNTVNYSVDTTRTPINSKVLDNAHGIKTYFSSIIQHEEKLLPLSKSIEDNSTQSSVDYELRRNFSYALMPTVSEDIGSTAVSTIRIKVPIINDLFTYPKNIFIGKKSDLNSIEYKDNYTGDQSYIPNKPVIDSTNNIATITYITSESNKFNINASYDDPYYLQIRELVMDRVSNMTELDIARIYNYFNSNSVELINSSNKVIETKIIEVTPLAIYGSRSSGSVSQYNYRNTSNKIDVINVDNNIICSDTHGNSARILYTNLSTKESQTAWIENGKVQIVRFANNSVGNPFYLHEVALPSSSGNSNDSKIHAIYKNGDVYTSIQLYYNNASEGGYTRCDVNGVGKSNGSYIRIAEDDIRRLSDVFIGEELTLSSTLNKYSNLIPINTYTLGTSTYYSLSDDYFDKFNKVVSGNNTYLYNICNSFNRPADYYMRSTLPSNLYIPNLGDYYLDIENNNAYIKFDDYFQFNGAIKYDGKDVYINTLIIDGDLEVTNGNLLSLLHKSTFTGLDILSNNSVNYIDSFIKYTDYSLGGSNEYYIYDSNSDIYYPYLDKYLYKLNSNGTYTKATNTSNSNDYYLMIKYDNTLIGTNGYDSNCYLKIELGNTDQSNVYIRSNSNKSFNFSNNTDEISCNLKVLIRDGFDPNHLVDNSVDVTNYTVVPFPLVYLDELKINRSNDHLLTLSTNSVSDSNVELNTKYNENGFDSLVCTPSQYYIEMYDFNRLTHNLMPYTGSASYKFRNVDGLTETTSHKVSAISLSRTTSMYPNKMSINGVNNYTHTYYGGVNINNLPDNNNQFNPSNLSEPIVSINIPVDNSDGSINSYKLNLVDIQGNTKEGNQFVIKYLIDGEPFYAGILYDDTFSSNINTRQFITFSNVIVGNSLGTPTEFVLGRSYKKGDIVKYDKYVYVCTYNGTGSFTENKYPYDDVSNWSTTFTYKFLGILSNNITGDINYRTYNLYFIDTDCPIKNVPTGEFTLGINFKNSSSGYLSANYIFSKSSSNRHIITVPRISFDKYYLYLGSVIGDATNNRFEVTGNNVSGIINYGGRDYNITITTNRDAGYTSNKLPISTIEITSDRSINTFGITYVPIEYRIERSVSSLMECELNTGSRFNKLDIVNAFGMSGINGQLPSSNNSVVISNDYYELEFESTSTEFTGKYTIRSMTSRPIPSDVIKLNLYKNQTTIFTNLVNNTSSYIKFSDINITNKYDIDPLTITFSEFVGNALVPINDITYYVNSSGGLIQLTSTNRYINNGDWVKNSNGDYIRIGDNYIKLLNSDDNDCNIVYKLENDTLSVAGYGILDNLSIYGDDNQETSMVKVYCDDPDISEEEVLYTRGELNYNTTRGIPLYKVRLNLDNSIDRIPLIVGDIVPNNMYTLIYRSYENGLVCDPFFELVDNSFNLSPHLRFTYNSSSYYYILPPIYKSGMVRTLIAKSSKLNSVFVLTSSPTESINLISNIALAINEVDDPMATIMLTSYYYNEGDVIYKGWSIIGGVNTWTKVTRTSITYDKNASNVIYM